MKQTLEAANRPFGNTFPVLKNLLAAAFCLAILTAQAAPFACSTDSFSTTCNDFGEKSRDFFYEKKQLALADSCTRIGPEKLNICRPTDPGVSVFVNFDNLILAGDATGVWSDANGSGATGVFPFLEFTDVDAGRHSFFYKIKSASAACPDSLFSVEIEIGETPVADAGLGFSARLFSRNRSNRCGGPAGFAFI